MAGSNSKVLAFIGDGEGKTSAAIGHAIRAAGHGKKVAILQFLKGQERSGEYKLLKSNKDIEIHLAGEPSFLIDPSKKEIHTKKAKEGLTLAKQLIESGKYFLIILDEIFDAAAAGLISNEDIGGLIDSVRANGRLSASKAGLPHIILTGRILPPELSSKIDLVTQMKKIKHYYDGGEKGIEGLDW